jgi:hypothetical protein
MRCFGMHLGLKLLLPLLAPLKIGGLAAFLASGNLVYLLPLILLPLARTGITLWRIASRNRPAHDYLDALAVGILPSVGSLAYPVQMYSRYPELSVFLIRDSAARAGRWIPVYGGKDSRVEFWAFLDLALAGTAPLRRWYEHRAGAGEPGRAIVHFRKERWHHLVEEQVRLIEQSDSLPRRSTLCPIEGAHAPSEGAAA